MIKEYQLRVLPQQAFNESTIKDYLSREEGIDMRSLNHVRVLKRSIDARQRTIFVNLKYAPISMRNLWMMLIFILSILM